MGAASLRRHNSHESCGMNDDVNDDAIDNALAERKQKAIDAAARDAYAAALRRRPCGFHVGKPGRACTRPSCGASWEEHYGAPPQDSLNARPRRAAQRGSR